MFNKIAILTTTLPDWSSRFYEFVVTPNTPPFQTGLMTLCWTLLKLRTLLTSSWRSSLAKLMTPQRRLLRTEMMLIWLHLRILWSPTGSPYFWLCLKRVRLWSISMPIQLRTHLPVTSTVKILPVNWVPKMLQNKKPLWKPFWQLSILGLHNSQIC